jgi:RHS repeat-associated protein
MAYVFGDHLSTPILLTDSTGATVWRAEYEPYGAVVALRNGTSSIDPLLRFPGQVSEDQPASGDEGYNIFRWYRAGWGRYLQSDPLGRDGDSNPYLYSMGAPLTHIDPLGERARTCCTPVTAGFQPFDHCFIHVEDPGTGKNRTYALHRVKAGVGCTFVNDWFDLNRINDPATKCGKWKEGCEGDRCVDIENAFYPRPIDYFLGGGGHGTNSNTYAAHITTACGLYPPANAGSWQTPGWNSSAPTLPTLKKTCPVKR